MIFRLPKYCVKIKTKAMQASSPSCMPNGSINIINIIVTTQFITERASPHILFFRSPIAPMIRITPKIAPINNDYYGAAEPPVRCGVSHLSGLTEPLH